MKTNALRITLSGLSAAGLAAGAWWLASAPEPTTERQEARAIAAAAAPGDDARAAAIAPKAAQSAPAKIDVPAACRFREGETRAWRITERVAITLDAAALFGGAMDTAEQVAPSAETALEAVLQVEAIADSTERDTVLLARLDAVNGATVARAGAVDAPFLVRVASDCSLTGFARAQATAKLAARTQQAIVHELSFALPAGPSASFEGRDATGTFSAVIAEGEGAPGEVIQRRIFQYRQVWGDAQHLGSPRVERHLVTVQRDARPWFASMEGAWATSGGGVSRSEGTLKVADTTIVPERLSSASREASDYVWEDLLPTPLAPLPATGFTSAEKERQARLKTLTLDDAVIQFAENAKTHTNTAEQWPELAAYLEARPDTVARFGRLLSLGTIPPKLRAPSFIALGQARVPEARDALLRINRDLGTSAMNRENAALVLVNRNDVDLTLAKSLRSDATHAFSKTSYEAERVYGRTAALALGMMAGVQAARIPGVLDEARAVVADLGSAAQGWQERAVMFATIGNIGDPSYVPDVVRESYSPEPMARRSAVKGLRRLSMAQTQAVFSEWLRREQDARVLRELYRVLHGIVLDTNAVLPPDLLQLAVTQLRAQPGVILRQHLVRLIGPRVADSPDAHAALVDQLVLEFNAKSDMFNMIAQYVSGDDVLEAVRRAQEEKEGAER